MAVVGRYVKMIRFRAPNIWTGEPAKRPEVPCKVLYPSIEGYVIELPEGEILQIHQGQIAGWMPEGWKPELTPEAKPQ